MQRIRLAVVGLNFGSWIIENELLQGAGLATMVIVAVCDIDAQKVASDFSFESVNRIQILGSAHLCRKK